MHHPNSTTRSGWRIWGDRIWTSGWMVRSEVADLGDLDLGVSDLGYPDDTNMEYP